MLTRLVGRSDSDPVWKGQRVGFTAVSVGLPVIVVFLSTTGTYYVTVYVPGGDAGGNYIITAEILE